MLNHACKIEDYQKDSLKGINRNSEAWAYYEEGLDLHDIGKFPQAEIAFLKAMDAAEKTDEKKLLAYTYHYLGRIEAWKSIFTINLLP